MVLDETTCRPRSPLRKMWTAGEARLVKHVLTNLEVRQWDRSYTEVDRSDPFGNWIIWIPEGGSGGTEGDYAFKLSATENMDENGDPYDPPRFTVNVLGGTAQTLGGTPYIYDDEELSDVEEGWHIYVVYENLEPAPSFTEYGEWRPGIKASSKTDMADYTAPHDLVFEIGRISKEYYRNVRQDHKGNIVMPAISNVVDIQTQLP